MLLAGESGIGKTRLATELAERARADGWRVAWGSAYPVEHGIPYAPFAEALLPLLGATLERGPGRLLGVFSSRGAQRLGEAEERDPAEAKTRILWRLTQMLTALARQQPLLLVIDNVQWADPSSLELLHFLARQIAREPVLLLAIHNPESDAGPAAAEILQSLLEVRVAQRIPVPPLTAEATRELIQAVGVTAAGEADPLARRLFARAGGNPFFTEQILKGMADGEAVDDGELPRSLRDAVLARLGRLSPAARAVAEVAAGIGGRVRYEVLSAVGGRDEAELVGALEELCDRGILAETTQGRAPVYHFRHPLLRDTLYAEMRAARRLLLHAEVADALESLYGADPAGHVDELAFHFARSHLPRHAPRALEYLLAAGSGALARHANREAADYLGAALERVQEQGAALPPAAERHLLEALARARQRLGDYPGARELWVRAVALAEAAGEPGAVARIRRRMGMAAFWSGAGADALAHYDAGLEAARRAGDPSSEARLRLARGACFQELGRAEEAHGDAEAALRIAGRTGDLRLLARVHRALLVLYAWMGPFDRAREHGERAVALAGEADEPGVACAAHMTLGMLEGLTGDGEAALGHLAASEQLAERIASPVLALWIAEMRVEIASALGDWDGGLATAERAIEQARRLGQRTLLPRLLVWAGMIHLGRGATERARDAFEEAWELSGAGAKGPADVHTAVPAHTGMAALRLALGDRAGARRIGEAGLAIADRSGYLLWAIHRLIPIIAEAYLWEADVDGAERLGERLRRESEPTGHRLGLAWADACAGVVAKLRGDTERAARLLRQGVERLDGLPLVFDAARLRRQLALLLAEGGDTAGAASELRLAHAAFARLGATPELDATRAQLRALGARPPARTSAAGDGQLTPREWEIARLAAAGASNKAIGRALGISPRTAGTHLGNLYRKLGVSSRVELAAWLRRGEGAESVTTAAPAAPAPGGASRER